MIKFYIKKYAILTDRHETNWFYFKFIWRNLVGRRDIAICNCIPRQSWRNIYSKVQIDWFIFPVATSLYPTLTTLWNYGNRPSLYGMGYLFTGDTWWMQAYFNERIGRLWYSGTVKGTGHVSSKNNRILTKAAFLPCKFKQNLNLIGIWVLFFLLKFFVCMLFLYSHGKAVFWYFKIQLSLCFDEKTRNDFCWEYTFSFWKLSIMSGKERVRWNNIILFEFWRWKNDILLFFQHASELC